VSGQDLEARVRAALADLPTESGGLAVVLATSGHPPAMAMLSSGDVHLAEGRLKVGIHASSSAVSRLGGAFTLLVPLGEIAARVEVSDATAKSHPPLAILEGDVVSVRPTSEPPWVLEMGFRPEPSHHPQIPGYLAYWSQVKEWLAGNHPEPPVPPA
jgi:hypothetical protein